MYADLTRLEDMRDQCEAGSKEWEADRLYLEVYSNDIDS